VKRCLGGRVFFHIHTTTTTTNHYTLPTTTTTTHLTLHSHHVHSRVKLQFGSLLRLHLHLRLSAQHTHASHQRILLHCFSRPSSQGARRKSKVLQKYVCKCQVATAATAGPGSTRHGIIRTALTAKHYAQHCPTPHYTTLLVIT
jgi:hypothetical protein